MGKRKGWPREGMHPHSLPLTVIGTGILWFGWAGFNAGSALAANGLAAQALLNTFIAASAAMLGWVFVEWARDGKPTTLGAASGAVAGLVAITPCAGFVATLPAMIIGVLAGVICLLAISLKTRFGYDDALDVVGVHLVGGLTGALLLGLFADTAINEAGADGLFFGGGFELLGKQAVASFAVLAFSFVVTVLIAKAIDATIGLRVDEEAEDIGLDLAEHAEVGYSFSELSSMDRLGHTERVGHDDHTDHLEEVR
jgi:Amt family ammonium transporter